MIVVADAGPLIALARIGHLNLPHSLYRLLQEPCRLWYRYLVYNLLFVLCENRHRPGL